MSERSATQDWQHLADSVVARRTSLGMTQQDVQAAGGPAVATLRHIEGAHQTSYRRTILGRLEMALGWTPGSVMQILAKGEPGILATEQASAHRSSSEAPGPGETVADAARRALGHLRVQAQAANRPFVDLLVEEGLVEPDELAVPDSLPPDRFIAEINASNISDVMKARVIDMHLKNRALRFEEERLKQERLDG